MATAADFQPTPNTTLHRIPTRGSYDRALAYAILDEGLYAHVGIAVSGQPFVIPMVHARAGDELILHGAAASRLLKTAAKIPMCATVTLVDGLVFARSAFHHSMNYRSVVILGQATEITDVAAKGRALEILIEHMLPGRSRDIRGPSAKELVATRVLSLPIEEASVKIRTGGPIDDDEDLGLDCWAGHLPIALAAGAAISDAKHPPKVALPDALRGYARARSA